MSPLFTPGPVEVAPEVLAAQARPIIPSFSQEYEALFTSVEERLHRLYLGGLNLALLPGSEISGLEALLGSFVHAPALCAIGGAAALRWYEIGRALEKPLDRLDVDPGEALAPERLADALREKPYSAVLLTHVEASTGVQNPLAELAAVVHAEQPGALLLVNAVSSLGGTPVLAEEWGIDAMFTVSDRCLALPPGLVLTGFSQRALDAAAGGGTRGWTLDLVRRHRARGRDAITRDLPVSLLYALSAQLDRILMEGTAARCERHRLLARRVEHWAEERGLPPLAAEGARADTLTVIQNRKGISIDDLNRFLTARGMRLANGIGPLRDRTLCIAAMGEVQPSELEGLLEAVDLFIGGA